MDASCHGGAVSPGTAKSIVQEWVGSAHEVRDAAGCADCHEPHAGHPSSCSKCHGGGSGVALHNPDDSGKCSKCHGPAFPDDAMMRLAPQHYGYSSARVQGNRVRAQYVSAQYQGRCRACHNPHAIDVTQNHRDYAKSLHGDPNGAAWTHYDMKQDNRVACQRCHTTTGFKYFVSHNFTSPTAGFSQDSPTREVIACDACHASYDYKKSIRTVAAFTAPYQNNNGAQASFPDSGASNICILCHSGRAGGQAIVTGYQNGNTFGGYNSHYMAAAGLMYMQIGFVNFTSPDAALGTTTYGKTLSPDDVTMPGLGIAGGTSSTHRRFGTPLITGYRNLAVFVPGVMDKNGPCVTCHLNAAGRPTRPGYGHSLQIDANAYRQVCINCHTSENTVPLTAENFRSLFLEPQKEAFESALELFEHELAKYGIRYDEATYPYFFEEDLQQLKDWTRDGTVDGRKLLGACFNFNLLKREPAAFAHARAYSRRLIYDSIDFLDDGAMNLSVGATALASGLYMHDGVTPMFQKGAQAYNTSGGAISTVYDNTSEAMLYLVGWSRSTGAWNAVERP